MKRLCSALYQGLYPFDLMFPQYDQAVVTRGSELQEGDILVVWGGADIHPSLYNKGRSQHSWADREGPSSRDMLEWELMKAAKNLRVPIIGICRGAQMLCGLAGGTLYQHVRGHAHGRHAVIADDKQYGVNSIHHQMMNLENTENIILAKSEKLSNEYWDVDEHGDVVVEAPCEPEFVYFPEVKGYAIQWHPEMMDVSTPASQHIFETLKRDGI